MRRFHSLTLFLWEVPPCYRAQKPTVLYFYCYGNKLPHNRVSLVAQTVKHLPTMRENWVRSLGQEDPLEKEMATYSSTLAWKIPWMEEHGRLQSMGGRESDMTEQLHSLFTHSPHTYYLIFLLDSLTQISRTKIKVSPGLCSFGGSSSVQLLSRI